MIYFNYFSNFVRGKGLIYKHFKRISHHKYKGMTYIVKSGDSLYSISRRYNVSIEQIRTLNQLHQDNLYPGQTLVLKSTSSISSSPQKYTVRAGESLYSIARLHNLSVTELKQLNPLASSNLRIGQELIINMPTQNPTRDSVFYHTVAPGESLYFIANEYGITVSELVRLNGLLSNNLRVGQSLKVKEVDSSVSSPSPVNNPKEAEDKVEKLYTVKSGDSLYAISQRFKLSISELMSINQLSSSSLSVGQKLRINTNTTSSPIVTNPSPVVTQTAPASSGSSDSMLYIVRMGDSLFKIANEFNSQVSWIQQANNLQSDMLNIGQQLIIPMASPSNPQGNESEVYHTVALGESLYSISQKYRIDVSELRRLNQLSDNFLAVGQRLIIQTKKELPSTSTTTISPNPQTPTVNLSNLPSQMKSILEARKMFKLQQVNGVDTMTGGLRGAIGRNRVNRPDDLKKVQTRLVQLNMLTRNHRESPEDIQKIIGNAALTANYIPLTIQAIERFQDQFKVRFWIEHSSRVAMMKTNSYTLGVVVPGDITDKLLQEYTEYTLSFPHPHSGQEVSVRFHNFVRSGFTEYYHGISYVGISNPEIPLVVFERLGADNILAEALRYVSKHEGNFDAINSYDKAIFSYGFIQFAGNGGGLVPMLAGLKQKAPQVFQEYFQVFGVDVQLPEGINTGQKPTLVVANPYDKGGKYLVQGLEAERVLRADKVLHGVFIRAGHYLPVVTMQIDAALRDYVRPALNIRLNIIVGGLRLVDVYATEFINSPMGITLMIDLTVNRWVNTTRKVFQEAIEKVAVQERLYNQSALRSVDERKVILQIIEDAKRNQDTRLIQRATSIYESDLSWQKKGN
jgi:peptidoglycan endopeptidase LytF